MVDHKQRCHALLTVNLIIILSSNDLDNCVPLMIHFNGIPVFLVCMKTPD